MNGTIPTVLIKATIKEQGYDVFLSPHRHKAALINLFNF